MAIQTINDALPTGDSPRQINQKINENFTIRENAASRLVGTANGNLVEMTSDGIAGTGWGVTNPPQISTGQQLHLLGNTGLFKVVRADIETTGAPPTANDSMVILNMSYAGNYNVQMALTRGSSSTKAFFRGNPAGSEKEWREFYTTGNTTIGTNKELVTSSPVVRVFRDTIEAIHEANDLPLEFTRNSEGDYTLKGTTGLRDGQNDWQIIIPKDDHDNQLIAFTIEEDNGTIHLKTYKRTFSMETFTFGPDLKAPLDIPEGRWVDLHFNDLPQEDLDEPEPEEEPLVDEEVVEPVEEDPKD